MRNRNLDDNPKIKAFYGAAASLHATVRDVFPRLTPPAPPPPRDSAPEAGEALPDHSGNLDAAALPPSVAAWAWTEGDSDDGTRR